MKKMLAFSLLVILPVLYGCGPENYGESCDKLDGALSIDFVTNHNVDSVKFWVNGVEFCKPVDKELFAENRGEPGYQGKREEFSLNNSSCQKVFACAFGFVCDKVSDNPNLVTFDKGIFVEVFSEGKKDTVLLNNAEGGSQYRVFPISDSSAVKVLGENVYGDPVCNGDYCIKKRLNTIGMCIDSLYNDEVHKNACTGGWMKDF